MREDFQNFAVHLTSTFLVIYIVRVVMDHVYPNKPYVWLVYENVANKVNQG